MMGINWKKYSPKAVYDKLHKQADDYMEDKPEFLQKVHNWSPLKAGQTTLDMKEEGASVRDMANSMPTLSLMHNYRSHMGFAEPFDSDAASVGDEEMGVLKEAGKGAVAGFATGGVWGAAGTAIAAGAVETGRVLDAREAAEEEAQQRALQVGNEATLTDADAAWNAIYGPVEQSLSDYYQTLTPGSLTAKKTVALQKNYQEASKRINENLAQRGMDTSGIQAQVEMEGQFGLARDKAYAGIEAQDEVNAQKQNFLNMGLQQKGSLLSNAMQQQTLNSSNDRYYDQLDYDREATKDAQNAALMGEAAKMFTTYMNSSTQATTSSVAPQKED